MPTNRVTTGTEAKLDGRQGNRVINDIRLEKLMYSEDEI